MDAIYSPFVYLLDLVINGGTPFEGIQLRHLVNFQKGATGVIMFLLMQYYSNFNLGCWVYLSLHGTYGLIWLLKDFSFPDKTFNKSVSFFSLISTCAMLILYLYPTYLMASGVGIQHPSGPRIALCVFLDVIGTGIMLVADCQKYYTLKYKQVLIDNGVFKYTRSPNFLGEILIYLSFVVCAGVLEAYLLYFTIWVVILGSFISLKERSNAKKKGWEKYKNHSWVLFPKLIPSSSLASLVIYLISTYLIYLKIS